MFQHAATYTADIGTLSEGRFDMTDIDAGIDQIVHFVAAGLRAPAI